MLKEMTVNAICNYIEENIELKKVDIDSLVEYSGYSRRYLQQLFSQYVGIPLGTYIQRRRIIRAAVLLRKTSLSIVMVSEKLCFDSQQTFTREFKKHTGYTPRQYRIQKVWRVRYHPDSKYLKSLFPVPELRYLPSKKFHGICIDYKERVLFTGVGFQQKWNIVKTMLSQNNGPLYVSHDVIYEKQNSNEFSIKIMIWTKKEEHSDIKGGIKRGEFAYFTYKGDTKGYTFYVNNIHTNILPYYGLQKKNGSDLEIISSLDNNEFFFEYYLPVYDEGKEFV
ncbi:TPA: helix-turn-helix domain-containing protein [Escherichia coli]|nr:helix-turn-helix domain-containing protein [Escherichia coli]